MNPTNKSLIACLVAGLLLSILLYQSQKAEIVSPEYSKDLAEGAASSLQDHIAGEIAGLGKALKDLSFSPVFQSQAPGDWNLWLQSQQSVLKMAGLSLVGVHALANDVLYFDKPSRPGQKKGLGPLLKKVYQEQSASQGLMLVDKKPAIVLAVPVKSVENQVTGCLLGIIWLDSSRLKAWHYFASAPVVLLKAGQAVASSLEQTPPLAEVSLVPVNWPESFTTLGWKLSLIVRSQSDGGHLFFFIIGLLITGGLTFFVWQQMNASQSSLKILDDTMDIQLPVNEQVKRLSLLQNVSTDPVLTRTSQSIRQRVEQLIQQKKSLSVEIRKLQESEKQLIAARDMLEHERDDAVEAPRLKSAFLSRMGDEITTPMKSVVSMLKLLSEYQLDDEPKQILNIAKRSTRTLVDNLNNILDFSKLDARMLKLKPKDFSVRELVDELSAELAPHANEKELSLKASCDPEIPATVYADVFRIRQILRNLLSNAIRFTKEGEVSVYADLTVKGGFKLLRFTVKDTGIGIPADAQSGLFDSLEQRTRLASSSFAGRLRLIVAKRLAELMGGEIGVISETGKGSQFWFTVRLDEDS